MELRIGTENDKQAIMEKYPVTAQFMQGDGYAIIAHEQNEILGFAFVFRSAHSLRSITWIKLRLKLTLFC